jgi:hypothetical protein
MLINKKSFSAGDTVSLKLVNGDEIITKFESDNGDSVTINRPMALTMGPQGLGMVPWMFLGDAESVTLRREHVFAMVASKKEAADQYIKNTTSIALL